MKSRLFPKLALVSIIWLGLTLVLYGFSAFTHGTPLVFLLGGAKNLYLATALTLISFFISFWLTEKIFKKEVFSLKEFLLQLAILLVLAIGAYLLTFYLVLGFSLLKVKILLSKDVKQAIAFRIGLWLIASLLGSFLGSFLGAKLARWGSKKNS